MRVNEINNSNKIKWTGKLTNGSKISVYVLSGYCKGFGEIGTVIMQIIGNKWKPFYLFVDKDWNNSDIKTEILSRVIKIMDAKDGQLA
jgi:hypothetical protein